MPDQNKPFVVTDRRKFSLDGTPRPDAERDTESEPAPTTPPDYSPSPVSASEPAESSPAESETAAPSQTQTGPQEVPAGAESDLESDVPPPPTQAEMDQASAAYQATSDRLETAVRAANPGMDRPPAISFESIVQSIFMSALLQLGATAPEGQQPRIDLMGARQSIDMLGILAEKTAGNLNAKESQLLDNALFELRMGFLEVTQALARSANRPGAPAPGPSIVR